MDWDWSRTGCQDRAPAKPQEMPRRQASRRDEMRENRFAAARTAMSRWGVISSRLADLVSRAYIQCMAEMAEDPRRSAERRRALELLAASPDGCTAAILLAHGFKSDRLVELINAGLASVTTERVIAGDRAIQVTRVQITDAGRQALDRPKARR